MCIHSMMNWVDYLTTVWFSTLRLDHKWRTAEPHSSSRNELHLCVWFTIHPVNEYKALTVILCPWFEHDTGLTHRWLLLDLYSCGIDDAEHPIAQCCYKESWSLLDVSEIRCCKSSFYFVKFPSRCQSQSYCYCHKTWMVFNGFTKKWNVWNLNVFAECLFNA